MAIKNYIVPLLPYTMEIIKGYDNTHILSYQVEKGKELYYLRLNPSSEEKTAYVRVADKSIKASKEVRDVLKAKKKDLKFTFQYGDKEKKLMEFLNVHGKITKLQFAELVNIPAKQASRTLVLMVVMNILKIIPRDKSDVFVLSKAAEPSYNNHFQI